MKIDGDEKTILRKQSSILLVLTFRTLLIGKNKERCAYCLCVSMLLKYALLNSFEAADYHDNEHENLDCNRASDISF